MARMDQRARQVVERVEQAEVEDVTIGAGEGLFLVEPVRPRALSLEAPRAQFRGELPGDVTDHEGGSGFGAGEVEPLEHILDHVVEHEPRGILDALPGESTVVACLSAGGGEDARDATFDGAFSHRACLHRGRGAA